MEIYDDQEEIIYDINSVLNKWKGGFENLYSFNTLNINSNAQLNIHGTNTVNVDFNGSNNGNIYLYSGNGESNTTLDIDGGENDFFTNNGNIISLLLLNGIFSNISSPFCRKSILLSLM